MAYFGNTGTPDAFSAIEAGTIYGTLLTNNAGTGNVDEIGINLHANYTGTIRLGIYAYASSANQPGALVVDAGEIVNPVSGWNSITGLSTPVTNATQYWLVFISSTDSPDYINFNMVTGTNNSFYWPRSGGYGPLPTPCPTVTGGEGNSLSMRANVTTASATAYNKVCMIIGG